MTTSMHNGSMQNGSKLPWKENRQFIESVWWGAVLIWAGLIFLADGMGFLPSIGSASAWSWVFLGAGLLAVIGDIGRLASPDIVSPTSWDWFWAALLLIVGLSGFANIAIPWALIVILLGLVIIVSTVMRRE